ncbi:alpha-L-arabinofuranosidase C-terminal domain-containing protein [Hymenobacter monticola]|uniref:non-reducing end alpha-L-arabinofuranosidase n=1 Tax=Hymenobacter monticola TaxID=1705399 RepID=A0ABY4BBG0_9BACT|nr:alpha-L-arabinofuranosidase C-terminal domain-containing protein [Hymenobacter monticola]UOE36405.1 carbohydrate binding domain-containing protein [Hymenobacter monticola]
MKTSSPLAALAAGLALLGPLAAVAQAPATLTVQVGKPGAAVNKTMYGLFFEDINFAADGGLYPELVKNKSFEISPNLLGWRALQSGDNLEIYAVRTEQPVSASSPHYLRVAARPGTGDEAGIENEGFRGMGIRQGAEYTLSFWARRGPGSGARGLTASLTAGKTKTLAQAQVTGLTGQWQKYAVVLRATDTEAKAKLKLVLDGPGAVDLDAISLFPKDTYNNRPNGLRPDLVQLLKDLQPGFLRFPGGCIVEGRTLAERYQWKKTIGDVDGREPLINLWNMGIRPRATPDYYQSFGLGFFEYFQLAEDIGAEPLPVLNVGMSCQSNSAELAPITGTSSASAAPAKGPNADAPPSFGTDDPSLDVFIQDALDLLEFANGPASSPWGARRVAMGHPKPFNLKYIGVGNEQWGQQYLERYEPFAKAVKAKYPGIAIVSSAGPRPDGDLFDKASKRLGELKAEYIDEHYYALPEWFREHADRYDNYPRTGPKIFAGEYAANGQHPWDNALSEAAFMTGLERNADVVGMAAYAPLFAHVNAWQWTPDLIWFDNLRAFGTPSYYVQQLFSLNKGTRVLPVALPGQAKNGTDNLFASAVADEPAGEVVIKLINYSASPRPVSLDLAGAKKLGKTGRAQTLASADLQAQNSLDEPRKVVPQASTFSLSGSKVSYTLAPYSFTVLRVKGTK